MCVPARRRGRWSDSRREGRCPSAREGDVADGSIQVCDHRVVTHNEAHRRHAIRDSRRDHGRHSGHRGESDESTAAGPCEAFGHSPRDEVHPLAVHDSRHRDFAYHADRRRRTRSKRHDCASDHRSPAVALSARRDGPVGSNRHASAHLADHQRPGDRAWPVREEHRAGHVPVRRRGRRANVGRHLIDTVMSEGGHPHHDRNSGHDEVQMGKKASPQSTDQRSVVRKRLVAQLPLRHGRNKLATLPSDLGV